PSARSAGIGPAPEQDPVRREQGSRAVAIETIETEGPHQGQRLLRLVPGDLFHPAFDPARPRAAPVPTVRRSGHVLDRGHLQVPPAEAEALEVRPQPLELTPGVFD